KEHWIPVDSPATAELDSKAERIDVVLVLDTSGSMQVAPLASAVVAARSFVQSSPAGVRLGLVTFADKPVIIRRITSNHRAVESGLAQAAAAGNTSLFDAVTVATRMFSGSDQRNIVLLTDGGVTTSKATLQSAIH